MARKKRGTRSARNKIPTSAPKDNAVKRKARDNNDLYRDEAKYPNQKLWLTIDIPPSVNHAYVNTRYGGKRLNKEAQQFVYNTQIIAGKMIKEQNWQEDRQCVWYYMDLYFYFPNRRKRDSHNCLKVLLDTLENVVYPNDYYVLPRIQKVELDVNNPRLEVCIHPMGVNDVQNE
jgi:crossover junction endodeoxyribonuclease RusA